jgi:aryl-alcohol dehydrogenase-like predicted oxidoreductase
VLERVAADQDVSAPALAQGWVLAQPTICGIVVGPRRLEHLAAVWDARDMRIDPDVIALLTETFDP